MIGTTVGNFEIREVIGEGGMGVIYRAWDARLKRDVALKFLKAGDDDQDGAQRLMIEARAASRLSHPGIVTLFEVGEHSGDVYLAMELLSGESLRDILRRGPLDIDECIQLATQMAQALGAAHAGLSCTAISSPAM